MSKLLPREVDDALCNFKGEMAIPFKHRLAMTVVKIRIDTNKIMIPVKIGNPEKDSHHYFIKFDVKDGQIVWRKAAEYIDTSKGVSRWQPQYGSIPLLWGSTFASLRERIIRECNRRMIPYELIGSLRSVA